MLLKNKNSLILLFAAFFLCLPSYIHSLNKYDPVTHLIFSRLFTEQFFQGDFFPRWLVNENAGFGAPSLIYYPSLQYYINLLFTPLNFFNHLFKLQDGYISIMTTAIACMVLSAFAMFKYAKLKTTEDKALLIAILYLIMPYRYAIEFYYSLALPEICAFIFMPLCLYYADKNKLFKLSFCYAGLLCVHLFTAAMFTLPFAGYLLLKKYYNRFPALIIGLCLAAYYLIPSLANRDLVAFSTILDSTQPYYTHFLDTGHKPSNGVVNCVLFSEILTLLVAITGIIASSKKEFYWLVCVIVCVFMTISPSDVIWKLFPQLVSLTFPWRFLSVASFFSIMILINGINERCLLILIIINLIFSLPILLQTIQPANPTPQEQNNMVFIDDYRTKWTEPNVLNKSADHRDPTYLKSLQFPDITITRKARHLTLTSKKSGWVAIPQFYFPNWHGEYQIRPQQHTGFIEINFLKPGTTELYFERSFLEILGFVITGLTIACCGFFAAYSKKFRHEVPL